MYYEDRAPILSRQSQVERASVAAQHMFYTGEETAAPDGIDSGRWRAMVASFSNRGGPQNRIVSGVR